MKEPFLKLENISKAFGKTRALSDINLKIKQGTFCVVLGPSGCGKSTLLNLIAGLDAPSSGRIYLKDVDITDQPPHKRDIAMVFQNYALYPHLNVFENMAFGLRVKGFKKEEIKARIEQVSKILNIEDKLDNFPRQLSGGQRQRVATGRAIVREPKLFLFDEPLSNLDARRRIQLRSEFIKLHRRLKKTIIYVTHDQVEAMVLGEVVVVLREGSIQQVTTPLELYRNPVNLFVAEFIGTPEMNIIKFSVLKDSDRYILKEDNFNLEVPQELNFYLEEYIDEKIYLGARPSNIVLREEGGIKGEVVFVQTLGEDNFSHIRLSEKIEINIRIENNLKLNPGQNVCLDLDWDKIYLFDSEGMRIYTKR